MAEDQFVITYEGPALAAGRMDVRLLAPALMALADAVQVAGQALDGESPPPALHIEATRAGSFIVEMTLAAPGFLDQAISMLAGRESTATANSAALVAIVAGAFTIVRKRFRTKQTSEEDIRPGWVRLTYEDGTSLDLPTRSQELADDPGFRRAAKDFVQPLTMDGVDSVSISQEREEVARIYSEDVPGFDLPPAPAEPLTDQTREVALRLRSLAFVPGQKWRVTDGENAFSVTIADKDFLARVEHNQASFSSGDTLLCELRTVQRETNEGKIQVDHTVQRVIRHMQGARQMPLELGAIDMQLGSSTPATEEAPPGDN